MLLWAALLKATWLALLLGALLYAAQTHGAPEQKLTWEEASDEMALCNDRTRAGFFISRNLNTSDPASYKWVIFLESGGLCFSNDTCNRRFFNSQVRREFNSLAPANAPDFPPFGSFDPQQVWDSTINTAADPRNPDQVVNPLMSSMQCFRNTTNYFPEGFELTGSDILDRNPIKNKLFLRHNHIIIPYCSSDLWLGEETDNRGPCDCFDFVCNNFNPSSESLSQFTFRGKRIFQSIIDQLMSNHNLGNATEVVLAGSSAGGVGVVNHAQWLRQKLSVRAELLVLFDSAWFINFQDAILRVFDGSQSGAGQSAAQIMNSNRLLGVLTSHPPCRDLTLGFPCCISAHCMFTRSNDSGGDLLYFPSDVRVFAISSIYDVFVLAPSIRQVYDKSVQQRLDSLSPTLGTTPNYSDAADVWFDFVINLLQLIREYGGAMNTTLMDASIQFPNLAFYLPQCSQHIYLATSSLWGINGMSALGNDNVELLLGDGIQFSHTVMSGRWNSGLYAVTFDASRTVDRTMQDALIEWYNNKTTARINPFKYRATCQGPYCYTEPVMCPDQFILAGLTANSWEVWAKIVIAVLIVGISIVTLFFKMLFALWLYRLEKKQDTFLEGIEDSPECIESLTFPVCEDDEVIAISCLDLSYSVTYRGTTTIKDERKDQIAPLVLGDIADTPSDSESSDDEFSLSTTSSVQRQSRRLSSTDLTGPKRPSTSPLQPVSDEKKQQNLFSVHKKTILNKVSAYFNPGELVAIIGPFGCGKTTFLDLLTGRRRSGTLSGEIYINGIPMVEIRDWYVANTGYVLQLARPYYEELTVRENMTLSAQLKLSSKLSLQQKFKRIEEVLEGTGLTKLADTVVGGPTGPGLSGGQKRRLTVALQLLKLPSVLYLDEPTAGLEATSSFELLSHLNKLADSNRTVILTIHQPRLEIFHMFTRLVLLSDGKVAYQGAPEKCYEVFTNALTEKFLEQGFVIPELENFKPADVIMDMLGNQKLRKIITDHYQMSNEPRLVKRAITAARWHEYKTSVNSVDSISAGFSYALFGARKVSRRQPSMFTRLATMEARGAKRSFVFFLPFMFFVFGFVLGTAYLQQARPFLVISSACVFSVASGLFMFPAMYPYYHQAFKIYTYERADGVGRAADLVLQGFIRFSSLSLIPAILSATVFYFMLVNAQSYDVLVFFQFLLVNIALSQTWIALLITLICAIPNSAFRVSSGISSMFGFTSGFFIPVNQLGWWWRWLVYINPNYYAVSSVAVFVLSDFTTSCQGSKFGCFAESGTQVLRQFNFDQVNPYLHLVVILSFTVFYLLLAIFVNWVTYTSITSKLKRIKAVIFRESSDALTKEFEKNPEEYSQIHEESLLEEPETKGMEASLTPTEPLAPIHEGDEESGDDNAHTKAAERWRTAADRSLQLQQSQEYQEEWGGIKVQKRVRINDDRPERPTMVPLKGGKDSEEVKSAYLREGDSHKVWRPKKTPHLADLVSDLIKKEKERQGSTTPGAQRPFLTPTTQSKGNLEARQRTVFNRVLATQELLHDEATDELLKEDKEAQRKDLKARKELLSNRILAAQEVLKEELPKQRLRVWEATKEKSENKLRDTSKSSDEVQSEQAQMSTSKGVAQKYRRSGKQSKAPPRKRKNEQVKTLNPTSDILTVSEYSRENLKTAPESATKLKPLDSCSTSANVVTEDGSTFEITIIEPGKLSATNPSQYTKRYSPDSGEGVTCRSTML